MSRKDEELYPPQWPEDMSRRRDAKRRTTRRMIALAFIAFPLGVACAGYLYKRKHGSFAPLLVSVATRVVPFLGDHVPTFPSPFGKLHISSRKDQGGLFVEITCEPCRMASKKIGPEAFLLPKGKVSGSFEKSRFRGSIDAEGLTVPIEGRWDGKSFSGTFELAETPVAKLYSLVRSIVPEAETAAIEGSVSGNGAFIWPQAFVRWKPKVNKIKVAGLVALDTYAKGPFRYPATDANDAPVELESGDGTDGWVPWDGLGRHLPAAAVAAEDGSFYSHPGFDVASMDEALKENDELKKLRRGASTITQQLAKNLFLSRERSYSRKLRELLYAVNLEQLGKRRILELYLNIVEWGPGIHGAKQAAQTYFRKAPNALLPEEAAWLAGIIRSPKRSWRREYQSNTPNTLRVEKIIRRMASLTDEERDQALARGLSLAR